MKNILIFGGTGQIGKPFSLSLYKAGYNVQLLSRNPQKADFPSDIKIIQWDGYSLSGWEKLINESDTIVNLLGENIGESRWTDQRKKQIRSSRIETGDLIVDAIRKASHKPNTLLQASAIGYYGFCKDEIIDETASPGMDYLARLCIDWEQSTQPVEEMGVRRIVIRTGIVLSTKGGALGKLLLPFRFFVGGPLGKGTQWWPWIHLDDQINAMKFLLENNDTKGVYNLCSPEPVRMSTFGKSLAKVLKRPYLFPTPAFALKLLLGEMSVIVLEGQRAIPKRLLESGYEFRYQALDDALDNII